MKACSYEGCNRTDLIGRGLCSKHYQRFRYRGTLDAVAPPPERKATACVICGGEIVGKDYRAIYCSRRCNERAHGSRRHAKREIERRSPNCEQCGVSLSGRRTDARFCSEKCSNERHSADLRESLLKKKTANPRSCVGCAEMIPPERPASALYCTEECKVQSVRKAKYGLTRASFAALLQSQDGRCAVCRTDEPGGKGAWHVDHDHATDDVRGLLCHFCNVGLGNFKDDPARLRAAAEYLERERVTAV